MNFYSLFQVSRGNMQQLFHGGQKRTQCILSGSHLKLQKMAVFLFIYFFFFWFHCLQCKCDRICYFSQLLMSKWIKRCQMISFNINKPLSFHSGLNKLKSSWEKNQSRLYSMKCIFRLTSVWQVTTVSMENIYQLNDFCTSGDKRMKSW